MEKHPWLPVSVYQAFVPGKQSCMDDMARIDQLAVTLPWSVHEYERRRALMGEDFSPYGLEPNRDTPDRLARYSFEQELAVSRLPVTDMFALSVLELSKT